VLEIDLVRHGESVFNRRGVVQGHTNSPLTELGVEQARRVGETLKARGIEAIYTSDLARAWETARIVGEIVGVEPMALAGIREIKLGQWEARPLEEIRSEDGEKLELWYTRPMEADIPGAEPLESFRERVLKALEEVVSIHQDGRVAVISHGGVLSVIISEVLGLDLNNLWHFRLNNASLSRVVYGYLVPKLVLLNDTCHMNGLESSAPSIWTFNRPSGRL
jgi:broad specificity phosphatase PhoE